MNNSQEISTRVTFLLLALLDFGYSFKELTESQIICSSIFVIFSAFSVAFWKRKHIDTLALLFYYTKEQLLFGSSLTWPVLYLFKVTGIPTVLVLLLLSFQTVFLYLDHFSYLQIKPKDQQVVQLIIILLFEGYLYYIKQKNENLMKQSLLNEISKDFLVQIFDKNYFEISENKDSHFKIHKQQTENTFLYSPKHELAGLNNESKDIRYKLYINEQVQSVESNQQQHFQKIVVKSSKELLQFLATQGKENQYFILAIIIDQLLNIKCYYRVIYIQYKNSHSLGYIRLDSGLFLRQNQKIIKYKQNLVSIFNHKLKTPLNSAIGHLITAKDDDNIPDVVKQLYLGPALLNCRLQLYLVQDILDYIQGEIEQLTLMTSKVNIQNLLSEVYDLIEFQCKLKKIQIQFKVNSENWKKLDIAYLNIYTDSNKLTRVLLNLLNNSYRFTEEGGWILLEIRIDQLNKITHFTITDSGIGMSEEQVDKLNSQLKQFDSNISNKFTTKQSEKNIKIGLSLYLASKLVKLLSGDSCCLQARIQSNGGPLFAFSIHDSSEIQSASSLGKSKHNSFVKQRSLRVLNKFSGETNQKISKFKQQSQRQIDSDLSLKFNSIKLIHPPEVTNEPVAQIPNKIAIHHTKLRINQRQKLKTVRKQFESFRGRATSGRFQSIEQIFRQSKDQCQQQSNIATEQFILIVDDEPFNHETLCMMLKKLGFQHFLKAFNGQQCIDLVLQHHTNISVIIMDIDMPIMNGIETTKQLETMISNNNISYIPIIGCTAHEDYESHLQCFDAGMIHVVVKPVFAKSLQEAFSKIQELKLTETFFEQAQSQNTLNRVKSLSSISK